MQLCIVLLQTMDREGYNGEHLGQNVSLQFTPCYMIAQQCPCSNITAMQPNFANHIHNAHTLCLSLQVGCWPIYSMTAAEGQGRDRLRRRTPNRGRKWRPTLGGQGRPTGISYSIASQG